MFRIKTDIRQYKCESREKVERLIRNWVIRPTDLIFDGDEQQWGPIGEHAAFVSTFAELASRESAVTETLVNEETAPEKPPVARGNDEEPEPPDPPEGVEPESASPDEITVMTEETLERILDDEETEQPAETQVTEPEVTQPEASRKEIAETVDQVAGPEEETDPQASPIDGREFDSQPGNDRERVGRHDLPEEIFATDEIDQSAEAAGYADVEEALQENARKARRQQNVDDKWDEILERLRETDELSKEDIQEISKTRDQIAIGRDEGEDDLDGEEVPDELQEYVSEGYQKNLPVDIGPSSRDNRLGLRRSAASKADKDRVFPYPGPKKEGQVERRVYSLRASDEHSLKVLIGVIGAVIALMVVAVLAF